MLLVGLTNLGEKQLEQEYTDKFKILQQDIYKFTDTECKIKNNQYPINYIEAIKTHLSTYEIVYIYYSVEIVSCLNTLNIQYDFVYKQNISQNLGYILNTLQSSNCNKILVTEENSLKQQLSTQFEWLQDKEIVETQNTQNLVPKSDLEQHSISTLTIEQLVQDDIEITEADVRDLKCVQNKLKVGMLLQAKNSLKRILKITKILDKLYDNLIDRIDESVETADTASLMYTADYLSKALSDTNQFIMSLINNDKIQNFFIIDNSNVINVNNNMVDIEQREKIRKATEIVMNNIDYFTNGEFSQMKNPNNVIEVKEELNGNSNT